MSSRYIFTFYEPNPAMDLVGERILVSLWRQAWIKAGLTPIVLSEWHASKHAIYREFDQAVSRLPSSNPANYDRSCFLRWLAVQVAAREYRNSAPLIVLCDYDVFPYFSEYHHLPPLYHLDRAQDQFHTYGKMLSLHGNCPALVIGTPDQFAEVCQQFLAYKLPPDKQFTSDQYIFEDFIIRHPEKFKVSMDVVLYSEPGWETASAIHFSNSVMGPKYLPKHQWIPKLRPI